MDSERLGDHGRLLACSNCSVRRLCMTSVPASFDLRPLDDVVSDRLTLRQGDVLYRAGAAFRSVHAIRAGSFKSVKSTLVGRVQVTAFHLPGEWLGFDGIESGRHTCDAIALEYSDVCAIPYQQLIDVRPSAAILRSLFQRKMSAEMVRDSRLMLVLGNMDARERMVTFLLDLSERFGAQGYARNEFMLQMKRADIASYLGLRLESASRVMTRLAGAGLVEVRDRRLIRLPRLEALRALLLAGDTESRARFKRSSDTGKTVPWTSEGTRRIEPDAGDRRRVVGHRSLVVSSERSKRVSRSAARSVF